MSADMPAPWGSRTRRLSLSRRRLIMHSKYGRRVFVPWDPPLYRPPPARVHRLKMAVMLAQAWGEESIDAIGRWNQRLLEVMG